MVACCEAEALKVVTEAIKESKIATQVLNKNNYLLSRNRIKSLIEGKNLVLDGPELFESFF